MSARIQDAGCDDGIGREASGFDDKTWRQAGWARLRR